MENDRMKRPASGLERKPCIHYLLYPEATS